MSAAAFLGRPGLFVFGFAGESLCSHRGGGPIVERQTQSLENADDWKTEEGEKRKGKKKTLLCGGKVAFTAPLYLDISLFLCSAVAPPPPVAWD